MGLPQLSGVQWLRGCTRAAAGTQSQHAQCKCETTSSKHNVSVRLHVLLHKLPTAAVNMCVYTYTGRPALCTSLARPPDQPVSSRTGHPYMAGPGVGHYSRVHHQSCLRFLSPAAESTRLPYSPTFPSPSQVDCYRRGAGVHSLHH